MEDRAYARGTIEVVDIRPHRVGLDGDHAAGSTTLALLVNEAVLNETGGQVLINGTVYIYTAYDDVADTMTLSTGLDADAEDNDWVSVYEPLYSKIRTTKAAEVRQLGASDNDTPIHAEFAQQLVEKLGGGIRGTEGEECLLELDGDTWRIVDIFGLEFLSPHPDPVTGGVEKDWYDATTIAAVGTSHDITLTYLPLPISEHVHWNTEFQPRSEWTRDGQVVTFDDPDQVCEVDDLLSVQYRFLDGAPLVTPPVPDPGIEYPAGTLHTPTCDAPIWVPNVIGDGWGSWQQTVHFLVDSAPGQTWFVYMVYKKFDPASGFDVIFDLTTYGGVNYRWLRSGSYTGTGPIAIDMTLIGSNDRHTPYEPQGSIVWKIVGAGYYLNYGPPYSLDDVPQDIPADPNHARIGVTDPALQNAYWGTKIASNAGSTTDEPYGPLPGGS